MPKLVLVRHGQSQWNLENRFTGWVDIPLTEEGRLEARRAGRSLKGMTFTKAFTSKLQRAQETLRIILEEMGREDIPIIEDEALNERHYGDLQGLNKAETAKKFGEAQVHIWRRSYDIAPPHGESLKDTAARTLPFFNAHMMPVVKSGQNVLVAAHGNSLRAIVMELDHLTKEQVLNLNIATGVPIIYEMDSSGRVLEKSLSATESLADPPKQ